MSKLVNISRIGYFLWPMDFQHLTGDVTTYTFGTGVAKHTFCPVCGVKPFYVPRSNPDGIDIKKHKDENGVPLDGVAFHPYHTSKALVAILIFLMVFSAVVFFAQKMGGYFLEHANFEPANMTASSIQTI